MPYSSRIVTFSHTSQTYSTPCKACTGWQNWTWWFVTIKLVLQQGRQKATFTTKHSLYKLRALLFRLMTMHRQFMIMLNGILNPMKWISIIVYLDNNMIHSCSQAKHAIHIPDVHTLLMSHGLRTKCVICAWACQKVNFCSFDIDKDSIHAKEYMTHVVLDWHQPQTGKNARYLLGLTRYYWNFIEYNTHIPMLLYTIPTSPNMAGDIGNGRGDQREVRPILFTLHRDC